MRSKIRRTWREIGVRWCYIACHGHLEVVCADGGRVEEMGWVS